MKHFYIQSGHGAGRLWGKQGCAFLRLSLQALDVLRIYRAGHNEYSIDGLEEFLCSHLETLHFSCHCRLVELGNCHWGQFHCFHCRIFLLLLFLVLLVTTATGEPVFALSDANIGRFLMVGIVFLLILSKRRVTGKRIYDKCDNYACHLSERTLSSAKKQIQSLINGIKSNSCVARWRKNCPKVIAQQFFFVNLQHLIIQNSLSNN